MSSAKHIIVSGHGAWLKYAMDFQVNGNHAYKAYATRVNHRNRMLEYNVCCSDNGPLLFATVDVSNWPEKHEFRTACNAEPALIIKVYSYDLVVEINGLRYTLNIIRKESSFQLLGEEVRLQFKFLGIKASVPFQLTQKLQEPCLVALLFLLWSVRKYSWATAA